MVPRHQPRPCRWTARRVECAGLTRCQIASLRADRVQVETLTLQQVRRVQHLPADPHTAGADPAGLAWSAVCCTVWHGSITGGTAAPFYIPYYNRAAVLTCTASGVAVVFGMCWRCCGAVIRSSVAQATL